MKILRQEPWNYTLYEIDGRLVLSVLCGSVGLFELNIPLTEAESRKISNASESLLMLVNDVRNKPESFKARSIEIEKK